MATVDPFGVAPADAIKWFKEKGYALTWDWRELWGQQHARAFTVAKMTQLDLLADMRAAIDKAIATGQSLDQFRKGITPMLQERGWWGAQPRVDPSTGEEKVVQLGSPNRLRTIYQTNLRQAMAAGRWDRFERTKKTRPYGRYVAILDGHERAEHRAWHGTVLPLDDPWWNTHYPPNGWGCRCKVQQLSDRDVGRYGYKVADAAPPVDYKTWTNEKTGQVLRVPRGIDPGFDYNPGKVPRGYDPQDDPKLVPLTPIPTWQELGRPPASKAAVGRPDAPAMWPAVEGEADIARTRQRFRELFGSAPGGAGIVTDPRGVQVTFPEKLVDHLAKDLRLALKNDKKPKRQETERPAWIPMAKATAENPYEIWLVPHRHTSDDHPELGRVVMRQRYIGIFGNEKSTVVVVDVDDAGNSIVTTYPRRDIDTKRSGYLVYQAPDADTEKPK